MSAVSASKRVAVIAGASGLVGSACLRLLLSSGQYSKVIAVVRRSLSIASPTLQEIIVDFDALPSIPELARADVFSALGTTMRKAGSREAFRKVDYDCTMAFASTAVQSGARQFLVVSSIGAYDQSHTFYLKIKGELEEELKRLSFASLHIFRPSFLVGDRIESRPGERVGTAVAKALDFAFVGKLKKYSAIEVGQLALAIVRAAQLAQPGVHVYEFEQIVALADP